MKDCVSNRVEEYRKKKGLTQEELADSLDVSRQTIISIEKGKCNPSLTLVLKISKYFNVSVEDIFYV
jgi:putative transcriptional regulator